MNIFQQFGNALLGKPVTPTDKGISYSLFESYAKVFGTHCAESAEMINAITTWNKIYQKSSTQVMKLVCKEAAKLTLTDFTLTVDSKNANSDTDLFNRYVKNFEDNLHRYLEQGIALGGLMFKPSEYGLVFVSPTSFVPTSYDMQGNISSVIFVEHAVRGGMYYTKLEYHHWVETSYVVETACFKDRNRYGLGYACTLSEIPEWANINAHVVIEDLSAPLFSYFRMPGTNNVDEESNYGLSLCSAALEYLLSFESTYKLFKKDLELSQKKIFVDQDALMNFGKGKDSFDKITHNPIPDLVVGLADKSNGIDVFAPKSGVDDYKTALEMILSMISTACGFTAGYFTITKDGGVAVTATQIESEDQVTVSTITAIRTALKTALFSAVEKQAALLMLYGEGTINYELTFYARDLSATPVADREHTLDLVKNNLYPLELYLKEYEGLSDAEIAKFMQGRAKVV